MAPSVVVIGAPPPRDFLRQRHQTLSPHVVVVDFLGLDAQRVPRARSAHVTLESWTRVSRLDCTTGPALPPATASPTERNPTGRGAGGGMSARGMCAPVGLYGTSGPVVWSRVTTRPVASGAPSRYFTRTRDRVSSQCDYLSHSATPKSQKTSNIAIGSALWNNYSPETHWSLLCQVATARRTAPAAPGRAPDRMHERSMPVWGGRPEAGGAPQRLDGRSHADCLARSPFSTPLTPWEAPPGRCAPCRAA